MCETGALLCTSMDNFNRKRALYLTLLRRAEIPNARMPENAKSRGEFLWDLLSRDFIRGAQVCTECQNRLVEAFRS